MNGSLPDSFSVQIAPGYGQVQLSTIPSAAWLDITRYVVGYEFDRGTDHELQVPDAGSCTVNLKDDINAMALAPNLGGWTNPNSVVPHGALKVPLRVTITEGGVTYPRFAGFVSKWGPETYSNGKFLDWTIEAYDGLADAQEAYMPPNYLGAGYLERGCQIWYPLTDTTTTRITNTSVQNFEANDASGYSRDGSFGNITDQYVTSVAHRQVAKPVLNSVADTLKFHNYAKTVMASGTWWFSAKVAVDNSKAIQTSKPMVLASVSNGVAGWAITVEYNSTNKSWYPCFHTYNAAGALQNSITGTTPFQLKNKEQLVVLALSGGTFTLYFNGVQQGTCSSAGLYQPNDTIIVLGTSGPGAGVHYNPLYGQLGDAALGSTAIGLPEVSSWWGFVQPIARATSEWIGLQLNQLGAIANDRAIDTGTEMTVEPPAHDFESQSVRSALEQTTLEEAGQLFVSADGTFTWYNRTHLLGTTNAAVTIGTTAGAVPVVTADIALDAQDLYTAGEAERGTQNPIIFDSAAEKTIAGRTGGYGLKTYRYPTTVNMTQNSRVRALVQWIVAKMNKEMTRVSKLTVNPWQTVNGGSSNAAAALLGLDVWANVAVSLAAAPGSSAVLSSGLLVQGIREKLDSETREWQITLNCTPAWNKVLFFVPDGTQSIDGALLAP